MEYTYELYVKQNGEYIRRDVCTNILEQDRIIAKLPKGVEWKIEITKNGNPDNTSYPPITSQEMLDEWVEARIRAKTWADTSNAVEIVKSIKVPDMQAVLNTLAKATVIPAWRPFDEQETDIHMKDKEMPKQVKDAINPSHYQGYVMDLQWLETMQYLPNMREPVCFKAALELQIRKYLDRNGKKDAELQELEKALWYLKFLVAYTIVGGPIRIKDIDGILAKK